ncbi:MAG: nucleotidyltransferase domain-containing protein [Cellulomonadaceae bacterium]|jgi:predicted nucleotidyltransferase|nr:nucleotidyltransferase domain-containing protein [Cellulomonadaceae bacterium]
MSVEGMSQSQIAQALGVSQSAVSQQMRTAADIAQAAPEAVINAAAGTVKQVAEKRGFTRLAVFGSAARGQARPDSDIDLLVEPPQGATILDLLDLKDRLAAIVGRAVDLVTYGGLKPTLDDDILAEAVPL